MSHQNQTKDDVSRRAAVLHRLRRSSREEVWRIQNGRNKTKNFECTALWRKEKPPRRKKLARDQSLSSFKKTFFRSLEKDRNGIGRSSEAVCKILQLFCSSLLLSSTRLPRFSSPSHRKCIFWLQQTRLVDRPGRHQVGGLPRRRRRRSERSLQKNKIVRSRIRESLLLLLRAAACLRHRDRCVHVDTVISVEDCGCGVRVGGVGGRPNFARRLCFTDWDEPVGKYFCKTKKSNLKTQKRWPAHAWSFDWCSIKRKF